jgi:4-amino-4-deoxy-L-arabinose transferase-like glycosyltransferase
MLRRPISFDSVIERTLTRREAAVWLTGFAIVSALIVLTRFASDDPDSALYAGISERLAALPPSRWIAPEWWGFWNGQGLFREHPAGVFFLPALLGWMGVPAIQASYVVGAAIGLACLLIIGRLVSRIAGPPEGRAALVLLQLMPAAFLFRIRSNHEYPMLLCLLLALVAVDGVRRSWAWALLLAGAVTAALLVKGVFVAIVLLGAALWALLNPTRAPGSIARPIAAGAFALAAAILAAWAYDDAYMRATGERFWLPYWNRQMGSVTVATPGDDASELAGHLLFYVSRVLWHSAPWGLALIAAAVARRRVAAGSDPDDGRARRGLQFSIAFAACAMLLLSPSSRFAERYMFSPVFAVAAAGAVVAYRRWPPVAQALAWFDARVPALPAALWTGLMLARLVLGPFLPRIS